MINTENDLEYCMEYQDKFPNDLKTAINFMGCRFVERATFLARTNEHFEAIRKCTLAAQKLINEYENNRNSAPTVT